VHAIRALSPVLCGLVILHNRRLQSSKRYASNAHHQQHEKQ
jgi:hypothetical protein